MPQYRIEISPNNRAGCKDTVCKAEGVKILKGELRLGTWVEINEHGSWSWKHWGCVSGSQVLHLQEACDKGDGTHDFEAIDGFDELKGHTEVQEKVQRCVCQGHIDPEDFKGDPEKNVPGEKGIRLTAKQKAAKDKAATDAAKDGSDEEKAPKKKASKRGRNKADAGDDEDEQPTVKKAKSSEAAKPSKATKPSKTPKAAKAAPAAKADSPAVPRGKSTAKSTAKKPVKDESDAVTTDEEEAPVEEAAKPPVKPPKAKTAAKTRGKADASENAPQKNRRSSRVIAKSSTEEDESAESEEPAPVAKSKRVAKSKKPAAEPAKPRRSRTRNA